jgi:hypothetical protein
MCGSRAHCLFFFQLIEAKEKMGGMQWEVHYHAKDSRGRGGFAREIDIPN